jgi:enoyl-CoA hydratase/carnithine racemase
VSYRRDDAVGVITMDDGKMNVMSVPMLRSLNAALDRAEADRTAVVIIGRQQVFSAGFDLAAFERDQTELTAMLTAGAKITERLLSFPAPVVAACNGHAIAMGAFLLLAADVRLGVAAEGSKICLNEVQIGLTVPRFGIEIARQRLTPAHFNRATIVAELFTPLQAVVAGFLDLLVQPVDLMSAACNKAVTLSRLVRDAHIATKLRAREGALRALHAAIEADVEEWESRPGIDAQGRKRQ